MALSLDRIVCGDCYTLIRQIDDESIHLVITSPPYFRQRDYAGNGEEQLGNEENVDAYIARLIELFRECVRVVRRDGNLVFNLGDKYVNGSLLLVPYRFAIAATETGLVKLVNEITWVKQNPTPRQFKRRLVSSTEPFFHFVRSDAYTYNVEAFRSGRQHKKRTERRGSRVGQRYFGLIDQSDLSARQKAAARTALNKVIEEVREGKIEGFRMKIRGIHSAPFGGQEGGRKMHLERDGFTVIRLYGNPIKRDVIETPVESIKGSKHPAIYPVQIVEELLELLTHPGDVVLDPFIGSGSTAVACKRLGRRYIGFELNPAYCEEANARLAEIESESSPPDSAQDEG